MVENESYFVDLSHSDIDSPVVGTGLHLYYLLITDTAMGWSDAHATQLYRRRQLSVALDG